MENKEIRILAIDDNHDNLITIKALVIEAFPYAAIFTALSGSEGLDLASKVNPDVVLLDVVMPEMDGFEVCHKLKEDVELCDVPVVFVTALKGDKESRIRGLEAGADAFLAKPIDQSELIAQIKAMVKIKNANVSKRDENQRLAALVAERTRELEHIHIATLNLLEDLREENEARQLTEDALRESEIRLVRAEIASKSGNWELHIDSNKMFASKGASKLYGIDTNLFNYEFAKEFPLPEYRAMLDAAMRNLIEKDKPYDLDFKIRQHETGEILDIHSIAFFDKKRRIVFGVIQDVTAQTCAQEALRESETHFRTLANSGQALIWTSGLNKKYDYFNQPWLDFTGRTIEQEIGDGWTENVHPDDFQMCVDTYVNAFERREKFYMEYRIGHHSGEYRMISDSGTPRYNSSNEFIGYIGHCMDITERKLAENKIIESEALYKAMLDATPDNITVTDLEGNTLMVSESTLRTYNLEREEDALGKNVRDYILEEDVPRLTKDFNNVVHGIQTGPNEYRSKKGDGSIFNIEVKGGLIKNHAGEISRLVFISRDITDRKKTAAALEASEIKYRELIDNSPEGITIYIDAKIVYINKEALRLMGAKTKEQLLGKSVVDFIHSDNHDLVIERMKQVAMAPVNVALPTVEEKYRKLDGSEFYAELKAMHIIFDGKPAVQLAGRDITYRKTAEAKIIKSENEFRTVWENSANGLRLTDESGTIIRVNKSFCQIFESTKEKIEGRTVADIYKAKDKDKTLNKYIERFENGILDAQVEKEFELFSGSKKWFQIESSYLDIEGEKRLMLGIFTEITERKQAEDRVRHLTRLYALLSQVNQAIVRINSIDELFNKICQVAVEYGQFQMAWSGVVDTLANKLVPVASFGHVDGYLDLLSITLNDDEHRGPAASAIFLNELVICNNIEVDDLMKPWRHEALKRGYKSSVAVPIRRNGEVFSILNLYASEIDFFSDDEQKLLIEVGEDISFAISVLDAEMVRRQTEQALIESENRYNTFINNNVDIIFVKDSLFRYLIANDALANFYGTSKDKLILKTDSDFANAELISPCVSSDIKALESDTPVTFIEKLGDKIYETTKFKMPLKSGEFGIGGIMHDITNRKKSELALEESRLELKAIYDNAPVMMCVVDEDTSILFQNKEFADFVNLSGVEVGDDFIGGVLGCIDAFDKYRNCGHGEDCSTCKLRDAIELTLETEKGQQNFEYHSKLMKNGEFQDVYLLGSTAIIKSSGQNKLLLTLYDITSRKMAEKALIDNNNRLELAMGVANLAWWEMDVVSGNIRFEKRKAEMLGYASEMFRYYTDFTNLLHPDDYSKVVDAMHNHLEGKCEKYEVEYRILASSGEYKYIYDIGTISQRDANGIPQTISGLVIDMTQRKESELALQKSEMFLRTFIDNTPFQIWVRDLNNVGILENKMSVAEFGSILGKKPSDENRVDKKTAQLWEKNNLRVMVGEMIDEEIQYVVNGKKVDYHQLIFPVSLNNEIVGIAGFNIDITDKKRAQEALQESQIQLKNFAAHLQNIREEERIVLAREIHDELGQILVAMKIDLGMLGMKATKFIKEEASEEFMAQFQRLAGLVDNTIKTARRIMTDLRPEVLDLLGLIEALKSHIKIFSERHNITTVFESELKTLNIETPRAVALFRILQESLNNVSKHAMATEVVVRLNKLDDSKIELEIKDNGLGFDMAKKKRNDSYGLIGMKERAFLLDGDLSIISSPGKGTTIRIIMPYTEELPLSEMMS